MATEAAPARAAGPTRLAYFDDMWALRSSATVLSLHQEEGGRRAVELDATVFHPQGGGQPADTGVISAGGARFLVEDVRMKDGVVCHYGRFEDAEFNEGHSVTLEVDAERRNLNSRLHSAGHLLDICMQNVGLSHVEPGKGYHFPDGAFVEYKGVIPSDKLQDKQNELEKEADELISKGAKLNYVEGPCLATFHNRFFGRLIHFEIRVLLSGSTRSLWVLIEHVCSRTAQRCAMSRPSNARRKRGCRQRFDLAEMQKFNTKIVDMIKSEGLFEWQGEPIILSQIENEFGPLEWDQGEPAKAYASYLKFG